MYILTIRCLPTYYVLLTIENYVIINHEVYSMTMNKFIIYKWQFPDLNMLGYVPQKKKKKKERKKKKKKKKLGYIMAFNDIVG